MGGFRNHIFISYCSKFLFVLLNIFLNKQGKMRISVAKIFANMHRSVTDMAVVMLNELKRYNYITPTNYLEFVSGYKM